MNTFFTAFLAVLLLCLSPWVRSEPLDLAALPSGAIGTSMAYLQEQAAPLALSDAMRAYAAGEFTPSEDAYPNFGIGARPAWVHFEVSNGTSEPVLRRLSIEAPWLDQLDVYLVREGRTVFSRRMGDRLPFADRPVASRFFAFDPLFAPGVTRVYIRVAGVDPMVLPIYLSSIAQAEDREVAKSYTYGFLYGGLLSLLAYNLMLFFSLKSRRYLVYSLYLAAFILMNVAYTGHGFRYLWPDSPQWQQFAIPILMVLVILVGFLFATTFLNTRTAFPRHNRTVLWLCGVIGVMELLAVLAGNQLAALLVSFSAVLIYSTGMILLGVLALRAGDKSARYYLGATIAHVSTAAVVALAVSGFMPYSPLAYRAVEVGMMLDAILLAMALADQFRINQVQKTRAEHLAMVDPLTQMNNRRAFYELLQPRWSTGLRKHHAMSVIALDLDHFKAINDSYGHAAGDEVLRAVAEVLRASARDGDILARWGGEEFLLFLDETPLAVAMAVAERLRHSLAALRVALPGGAVAITASLGVAQAADGNTTIEDLISRADSQLYRAKESGRNRVCSARFAAVAV